MRHYSPRKAAVSSKMTPSFAWNASGTPRCYYVIMNTPIVAQRGREECAMNVAVMARPFQVSARWLIAGLLAVALFAAAAVHSAPVGAAVWCGGQYTTYCPLYAGGYYPGYAGYPYG